LITLWWRLWWKNISNKRSWSWKLCLLKT
jgi:hypothetical protein